MVPVRASFATTIALSASSCVVVPNKRAAPAGHAASPRVGTRFEVTTSSLSTSFWLPAAGSLEHKEPRSFQVRQRAIIGRAHAVARTFAGES